MTSASRNPSRLSISDSGQSERVRGLAAAVSAMFGETPSDSIVLAGLDRADKLRAVARVGGSALDGPMGMSLAASMVKRVTMVCTQAVVLVFGTAVGDGVRLLQIAAEELGLAISGVWAAGSGPHPPGSAIHPNLGASVEMGEASAAVAEGPKAGDTGEDSRRRRECELAAWVAAIGAPERVTSEQLALMGAGLLDSLVRDAVLVEILTAQAVESPGPTALPHRMIADHNSDQALGLLADRELRAVLSGLFDPDTALAPEQRTIRTAERLLTQIIAAELPGAGPAVNTLLGLLAWWCGEPVRARELADTALAEDPGYTLARQLHRLCMNGLSPGWLAASSGSG